MGSLKGVSSPARGGSSETSVDSGEGGRHAQPLKGVHTPFWESGGEVEEPGKGENKTGNLGGKITQIQFFTLFPALIHFLFMSIGDCLRGAVISSIKLEQFGPLLYSEWWLSWEAWFFNISEGRGWRKWEERESS